MKKRKIRCINCRLPIDADETKCPYCGKEISDEERKTGIEPFYEAEGKKKSHNLQKHTIFYLIALGLEALCFLAMIIPVESTFNRNGYYYISKPTQFEVNPVGGGSTIKVVLGINAPLIVFIFLIVCVLNSVAILWSLKKKSQEIGLFSYFTAFYGLVIGVVSFLGTVLMSYYNSGNAATTFAPGVGFFVIGVFAIASIVFNILGVIKYKKYLYGGSKESISIK